MKIVHRIITIISVVTITTYVFGQSNENQLYYTSKATVKPERLEQYLELSKKWANACREHNFPYSFSVWQSNIYDFYWFYPVDDYNHIKEINEKAWELVPKLDEDFGKDYNENLEFYEDFFIHFIDSLTYNPQNSVEGNVHAEWLVHYLKPWTGMSFRKAFKAATEIYKNNNFEYSISTLQSDIGMNGGSALIRVFWGKDAEDLNAHRNQAWESLGNNVQQQMNDLNPYRRSIERIPLWFQKELSYSPE